MKRTTLAAWAVFGLIILISVWAALLDTANAQLDSTPPPWIAYLVGPTFALVGALILARQPGNRVGRLLLLPGLSAFVLVDAYLRPLNEGLAPLPPTLTPTLWLALWYSNWNWTLLIFPLPWLMLLFPTGRPISRRWGWLMWVGVILLLFLLLLATFGTPMQPGSGADWSYRNPIGLIESTEARESTIFAFFAAVMPVWVALCLAALVVRYRRAGRVERQQMKWLLVATALFVAAYVPVFILTDRDEYGYASIFSNLWMIAMPLIPAAIGIAILRYRLFDIDLIIRKTLQYAVLSALLALAYFGSVVLLQTLFGAALADSPLLIVLSTLLIAALFAPLRQRVQAAIDRRFYRQKYDAQQVLAQFAITARDETDMDKLTAELVRMVQETMQPESVSLWLKPMERSEP